MPPNSPDNPISKISIIKARLRSENEGERVDPFRETRLMEPPAAGQYVSSTPFRSASPPPDSGDNRPDDDGFRAAPPLQGGFPAVRPSPPLVKRSAGTSGGIDPFAKAGATTRSAASPERPASPIQKAPPTAAMQTPAHATSPLHKSAPPSGAIQKSVPAASPLQRNAPPTGPIQKSAPAPRPLQKAAPVEAPQDSGAEQDSGEISAAPVILRPHTSSPAPTTRANSVAGLVTRALGAHVTDSGVPPLQDLATLAKSGGPDAIPAPTLGRPGAPTPPGARPSVPTPPTSRLGASPPPAGHGATGHPTRLREPEPLHAAPRHAPAAGRLAAASVEAFMEGRTDGASLKERELAIALRNLQNAGWMFLLLREGADTLPLEAAGTYRHVLDDKRTREGETLQAVDPKARAFRVTSGEQLASLDYFHGTGAPASLKNPALAKRLQALAASGLLAEGDDPAVPGTWGAYVALMRGERAALRIEGVEFGEIRGTSPADVDAASRSLTELLAIHRDILVPEAQAGHLELAGLGSVLQALHWEVPDVPLPQRTQAFLRLAEALPEAPDGTPAAGWRTSSATLMYEAIIELDVGGEAFCDAVTTMETLIGVVGPEQAREPLQFLYREAARSSPFSEARREREEAFRRVIAHSVAPGAAIEIVQQIVARPWDEDLETRLQLFEALAEMAEPQPGYGGIMTDFETVLRFRSTQESLEDAARPYLAIFDVLASRRCAEEAAPTWAFLHEGLRYGHLESDDGSLHDLADRFVALFTQVGNVQEARQRLLHYS